MYVVYAERRPDWAAEAVALAADETTGRQLLTNAAAELCRPGTQVIRCRLRKVRLAAEQVRAIVRKWAREDAAAGLTLHEATDEATGRLPPPLLGVYLQAFEDARQGV